MTLIELLNEHYITSALVIIILATIAGNMILSLWGRLFRYLNIRKHGYPPEHCDADGDNA